MPKPLLWLSITTAIIVLILGLGLLTGFLSGINPSYDKIIGGIIVAYAIFRLFFVYKKMKKNDV